MRKSRIAVLAVVVVLVAFFFVVPVVYYNPVNKLGHASGYESLSCALLNVGISYGYHSLSSNDWGLSPSCGFIHV